MSGMNILVMDDDAYFASLYSKVLRKAGHDVYTATHLYNARSLINTFRFDVLVIDSKIDRSRGTSLLAEQYHFLRELGTEFIVVANTPQTPAFYSKIGVKFFLFKPVLTSELLGLLNKIAQQPRQAVVGH